MDRSKRPYIWGLAIIFMAIGLWQTRQATSNSTAENPTATGAKSSETASTPSIPATSEAPKDGDAAGDSPTITDPTDIKTTKPMSLGEFRNLTKKTLAGLPTLESLHALDASQVHETPTIMMAAGNSLGQIAQIVHDDPSLKNEGLSFYETCYVKENLPPQIRALCVADHRNLRISQGDGEAWLGSEAKLPANILSLAQEIPSDND